MAVIFSADRANAEDRDVAGLDPLGADAVMAGLPEANERADLPWILATLHSLAEKCTAATPAQARAALRDLGFLAASACRHDPGVDLGAVEPLLLRLGRLTSEVPRDTVYSYATRNPVGPRWRSFVGSAEERLFIDSVSSSTVALNEAIEAMIPAIFDEDCDSDGVVRALRGVNRGVEILRDHLLAVKRAITPEYFSSRLRPYFPDLELAGVDYAGPGGAQMPLLVLDVLLVVATTIQPVVVEWRDAYIADNLRYLPPEHREVAERAFGRLVTGRRSPASRAIHADGLVRLEIVELLRGILRFRYPHRQVARENMRIRPEGALGSGGYQDTVLDKIIDANLKTIVEMGADRS